MSRLQHISAMYRVSKSIEVPQKVRNYGRSPAVQQVFALRDLDLASTTVHLRQIEEKEQVRVRGGPRLC